MKTISKLLIPMLAISLFSCTSGPSERESAGDFRYEADKFEDVRILRYRLPAFDDLSIREKQFVYFLSEAALCGRDILWDQNFRYNLVIRKTIEAIILSYDGEREDGLYDTFEHWAKRVFFANGIHHHYSNEKMLPGFTPDYFRTLIQYSDRELLPAGGDMSPEELADFLIPLMFDPELYFLRADQRKGTDLIAGSAVNFYEGISQQEAEDYYASIPQKDESRPVSLGLNSRLVKEDGRVREITYRSGGLYGEAIDRIIAWLEKAAGVAGNDTRKKELELLIDYYRTGDLETWDRYNVLWAGNTESRVDYINGFIETYVDPMGMKATWEATVSYKDAEASKRADRITSNAQWFEDNSPVSPAYKKEKVSGVSASVVNIAMLGGDCYPASPLGINLPNSDWIRAEAGSKSVTLANISDANEMASLGDGFLEEYAFDEAEVERARQYGSLARSLHTDLHECIGHASGKLAPGTDPNALKNYASPLEEARADLFALYYMADKKLVDLGLFPDEEAFKASYDSYLRNGLITQLVRIRPGKQIEQAHMRCRAAISRWVYEKGRTENVVEMIERDDKVFVRINDYRKLRHLFGEMLAEVQRIKSEGDFEAGRDLIENYGVKVDPGLHAGILERYEKLNLAPYTGFINPMLTPVFDNKGRISDVHIDYVDDYLGQMIFYGRNYSFLAATSRPRF